jgi:hypothetical protein
MTRLATLTVVAAALAATAGGIWMTAEAQDSGGQTTLGDAKAEAMALTLQAERLMAEREIENLQAIYGFYIDKNQWTEAADLFADDGTIEIGHQGVYVGKDHIRAFLGLKGPEGPQKGVLDEHTIVQPVVTVSLDGKTATARFRDVIQSGTYGESGTFGEGIYENEYVKQDGIWKIKALHLYTHFLTDYDKGLGQSAEAGPGPSTELPPDRPPSVDYQPYPADYTVPLDFKNPGSGKPTQYSGTYQESGQ